MGHRITHMRLTAAKFRLQSVRGVSKKFGRMLMMIRHSRSYQRLLFSLTNVQSDLECAQAKKLLYSRMMKILICNVRYYRYGL